MEDKSQENFPETQKKNRDKGSILYFFLHVMILSTPQYLNSRTERNSIRIFTRILFNTTTSFSNDVILWLVSSGTWSISYFFKI